MSKSLGARALGVSEATGNSAEMKETACVCDSVCV